jgi:hypothetical protein
LQALLQPKTTVTAVVEATASTVLEMATTAKIILIVFLNFSMSPPFLKNSELIYIEYRSGDILVRLYHFEKPFQLI